VRSETINSTVSGEWEPPAAGPRLILINLPVRQKAPVDMIHR
jgi:hypothetical protein